MDAGAVLPGAPYLLRFNRQSKQTRCGQSAECAKRLSGLLMELLQWGCSFDPALDELAGSAANDDPRYPGICCRLLELWTVVTGAQGKNGSAG